MTSPTGYQVGTAWVQVLPSFKDFHKRARAQMAGLGDIRVDIEPQVSSAKVAAAVKTMDERVAKTPVTRTVDLDLNDRLFNAKLVALAAKRDEMVMRIDADISVAEAKIAGLEAKRAKATVDVDAEISKAEAKIAYLESKRGKTSVDVDAEIAKAEAKIAFLQTRRTNLTIDVDAEISKVRAKIAYLQLNRDTITVQFDIDSDDAEEKIRRVEQSLDRVRNNQADINMEASDASRAIALIGALTVALSVLGHVAPAAAAAVATVPNAITAAVQGFAAAKAGLSGIGDATKALQTAVDETTVRNSASSKQRITATNQVAAAQSSLQRALEQADRAAIQGARQVQGARDGLADAQVSAARRVEDAEDSLHRAQVSARDAQEALTRARKEATEHLEDLRLAVSGAALDEEGAVLALQRAQERLNKARAAGTSGLDLAEIELSAREAEHALAEVRERYGDLREESEEANRAGVDGSRQVVAAQRQAEEAAQRIRDAERDLAQARVDGARQVAQAQERVAEAQQQASWAATDASRAVADAQRSVANAAAAAGDTVTASMDRAWLAMQKLTPEGRRFALFLQGDVKPALQDIGAAAQSTMLPKVQDAFSRMLTLAPMVEDAFADAGNILGDIAVKGSQMVTSGPWRKDFQIILDRNNRLLATMGDAGLSALSAFRHLAVASGPLAESLASIAEAKLDQFNAWLQELRDSGELRVWFAEMSVRIQEFFATVGQLTGGAWDLLQALAPLGRAILDIVGPIVQFIGAVAEANPVLTAFLAIGVLGISTFVSFFRTIGGLRQAFSTSIGVYQNMRNALLGVQQSTDGAAQATTQATTATQNAGAAANNTRGLVGRLGDSLNSVGTAYGKGSVAAKNWATATAGAADKAKFAMLNQFLPAMAQANRELDYPPPVIKRTATAFESMATTARSAFSALGTTVQNALGTVTTAAQGALTNVAGAVGGTVAAVGRGVTGMVTGLVGALGGPFGIAIIAATVGLGFLVNAQAEAAQAAAEHKAQVQALTDALVESGGAIDENVKKQIRLALEQRSVADNAKNLGLNVGTMIRAVGEGGQAAHDFEKELTGLAEQLTIGKGLARDDAVFLEGMARQLLETGGSARDFSGDLNALANDWQRQTGASDEATESYHNQLIQYLDLIGGYRGAKGDFDTAEQEQRDIADAQSTAASQTERHTRAIKDLQDEILGQIDKDLAYRQSLQSLAEAQGRVAEATGVDLPAALLAEEQALLEVIQRAGDLAYTNSEAADESGRLRDQVLAQAQAAADLANKYSGPLPTALQAYLDKLGIAKTETDGYVVALDAIPTEVLTNARFDDADARSKIVAFYEFMHGQISAAQLLLAGGLEVTPANLRAVLQEKKGFALGGIAVPAYANGAVRTMSARTAEIVPARTPRLIGDRMQGDEAFVPINGSARSIAILAEAARRMGFALAPMAFGAVLGMQAGGVNTTGGTAGGADTALTLNAPAVDTFSAAVQELTVAALVPLATEVNTTTTPALSDLDRQANTTAAVFDVTAKSVADSWHSMAQASTVNVIAIGAQLATLRQGVQTAGTAFASTAEWIRTTWDRIREYVASPVRSALSGPYNSGLVPAWNHIDSFFNLGKPLGPVPIPFRRGGKVPGTGNRDSVLLAATPGEYIISKPIVKKWGLRNIHAAHEAAKRGGFPGLEGMFAGDESGIAKIVPGFASGGPVPEALARANAFGRSMHGKPYIWGGSSEAGTDCSGWMAMLARAIMDVRPYARREWATGSVAAGNPPPRFSKGIDGLFAIGVTPGVHTAGTLAGRNVESGGAHNFVAFGPPSVGADNSQFPLKFHLDALGGKFVSGGAGGAFDLAGFIRDGFNATYQQLGQMQEAWGANMMAQASTALVRQAADAAVNWAVSNIAPMGTSGDVESWRPLVLQALRMLGLPLEWADITLRRMAQESGGNPRAVNLWDSNAQRGDPSKGLMQVIGSTFRAYRDPRAPDDVFDPLANILASAKYAMARYGSLPAAYGRAGGYDNGGLLPPGYSSVFNGLRRPEMVLTDNQWSTLASLAANNNAAGGEFRGNLYLSSGEFLGVVEGVVERANTESGRALARRIR